MELLVNDLVPDMVMQEGGRITDSGQKYIYGELIYGRLTSRLVGGCYGETGEEGPWS